MFYFDKGRAIAINSNGSAVEFGTLQDVTTSFKVNLKELYGRNQSPVYVARGKQSVDIKGNFAALTAVSLNQVLQGTLTTGIRKVIDPGINLQVPSSSPYTATLPTVPQNGVLNKLLCVYDVSNPAIAVPMNMISNGSPTFSETFTFSATDVAGARTYTVTTNFAANDTVNIGGVTLTAVASGATGFQFNIGAAISNSITNLVAALNAIPSITQLYTITSTSTTITFTETNAGGSNTPGTATVTGTGVMTSGAATISTATNTLTFSSQDAGKNVQVLYDYTVPNVGNTITLNNNAMGAGTAFQLELFTTLAGYQINLVLLQVMSAGLDLAFKTEDYTIPNFEAKAFSSSANILGYLYIEA